MSYQKVKEIKKKISYSNLDSGTLQKGKKTLRGEGNVVIRIA